MDEIGHSRIGVRDPSTPSSLEYPPRVHGAFYLGPILGLLGLIVAMVMYRPLDDKLLYWIGASPCLISWILIINVRKIAKSGKHLRGYFRAARWLSLGSLCVPLVLLWNGAWDHSPVEQHREMITRNILEHGRRGSVNYYVEVSSWRQNHLHEKLSVSREKYLEFSVGDPVVVETHSGALGIPLLVSVHRPE